MPSFPDNARLEEQEKLVGEFTAVVDAIVVAMNVEDIHHGAGQGL